MLSARIGLLFDRLISERWVMGVILLNTLVMTLGGFYQAGTREYLIVHAIDYLCVLYYIGEAAWKIHRLGWKGYRSFGWNRFDFLVTVLCLPVLLEPFTSGGVHYLTWLPVFRAGRLFRLLRLLRFIPDSMGLAQGVVRALKASVGVFLALALVNLMFALSAHFIFGEIAPERFGDPAKAVYSIFQIFTIEGWNEFPELIEKKIVDGELNGAWIHVTRAFFGAAVLVGGILGFSMANAVFIDEMTLDNNRILEQKVDVLTEEVRDLHRLLEKLSGDGLSSNRLSPEIPVDDPGG